MQQARPEIKAAFHVLAIIFVLQRFVLLMGAPFK